MLQIKQASLANRVILKPFVEKQSKGGIVIARDERSQAINTDQGEVLYVGDQCWYDFPVKPDIVPGDKVYYSKYGAKVFRPDDQEDFMIICNDTDILFAFEGKPDLEHADE